MVISSFHVTRLEFIRPPRENSAFHPSWVNKSSTNFKWGWSGKATWSQRYFVLKWEKTINHSQFNWSHYQCNEKWQLFPKRKCMIFEVHAVNNQYSSQVSIFNKKVNSHSEIILKECELNSFNPMLHAVNCTSPSNYKMAYQLLRNNTQMFW